METDELKERQKMWLNDYRAKGARLHAALTESSVAVAEISLNGDAETHVASEAFVKKNSRKYRQTYML